jgi:hypothetical protein
MSVKLQDLWVISFSRAKDDEGRREGESRAGIVPRRSPVPEVRGYPVCKRAGARHVVVTDVNPYRLDFASRYCFLAQAVVGVGDPGHR